MVRDTADADIEEECQLRMIERSISLPQEIPESRLLALSPGVPPNLLALSKGRMVRRIQASDTEKGRTRVRAAGDVRG